MNFCLLWRYFFYFSSTIFSSVKLTNNRIIFCTAFYNECFLLFFIQSTSIHKIFLWANRKKPFLWKVIFRHDTLWPRAGILTGEALLFDVSWLRCFKSELFLWFRVYKKHTWCYCKHVNRPGISLLQHSSFSKPMLFA